MIETKLDELSYSLYAKQYENFCITASKNYFMLHKDFYNEYYIKAKTIIRTEERKQKLKKLKDEYRLPIKKM